MKRRKSKTATAPVNGAALVSGVTSRLFDDGRKLSELRNVCGHLQRVAQPGPKHLQKFVERVFAIAGVGEQEATPQVDAAQS